MSQNLLHVWPSLLGERQHLGDQVRRAWVLLPAPSVSEVRPLLLAFQVLLELRLRVIPWRIEGIWVCLRLAVLAREPQWHQAHQAEEATAERPDIALVRRVLHQDLGRHRRNGACRRLGAVLVRLARREEFGEANVDDDRLRRIDRAQHHVLELQVAVHHTLPVDVGDALADLVEHRAHPLLGQRVTCEVRLLDRFEELAFGHVIRDQVQRLLVDVILKEAQNRRVVQSLQLVDLLHNHFRWQSALQCRLLIDGLKHPHCTRLLAEHLADDTERALADNGHDFIVVGRLSMTAAQEHIAAERRRLLFMELSEQEASVHLAEFRLA
mmetsp:Transcript_68623/g.199115  ORF Transcript_68623/g.199115 Transcript_68623/m.199115 type:complete len:325 (+) Transcript_68623:771-1745(+)